MDKKGYIKHTSYSGITEKDIYESLWRCRDFELSNLWQRSVFLTAFILITISGYGYCLFQTLSLIKVTSDNGNFIVLFIFTLFVNIIGIILSALWIMMAIGSKAWYEKYEEAIYAIERDSEISDAWYLEYRKMMHGSLPPINMNNNPLSRKAGAYSVSKINIFILKLKNIFMKFWKNAKMLGHFVRIKKKIPRSY